MNHSILTEEMRRGLIRQLVFFDEHRFALADRFASGETPEKKAVERTVALYRTRLERILSGVYEDLLQSRVLIGSEVRIRFEGEPEDESYRIVLPDYADVGRSCVSFLSPLGRGLLFAKCSDSVTIETPQGESRVLVIGNEYRINF